MRTTIAELKSQYIKYFEDVPVQKYAAMSIKRNEDTIIKWRRDDTDFADQVEQAKAEFIRKKVIASKAEFVLERMFKDVFTPEITLCSNCRPDPIATLKASSGIADDFLHYMEERTSKELLAKSQRGDPSVSLPVNAIADKG